MKQVLHSDTYDMTDNTAASTTLYFSPSLRSLQAAEVTADVNDIDKGHKLTTLNQLIYLPQQSVQQFTGQNATEHQLS